MKNARFRKQPIQLFKYIRCLTEDKGGYNTSKYATRSYLKDEEEYPYFEKIAGNFSIF